MILKMAFLVRYGILGRSVFFFRIDMGSIINCECEKCNCNREFETIDGEELLNLIQHGRLTEEKVTYLKSRVGSKLCKSCFIDEHT